MEGNLCHHEKNHRGRVRRLEKWEQIIWKQPDNEAAACADKQTSRKEQVSTEEVTYIDEQIGRNQIGRDKQISRGEQTSKKEQINRDEQIKQLLRRSQQGDKQARDTMVQNNMGLVWSIVRRFTNRGYELEDLFQIGSIGLMKAVDKFDTSFDVKFSTYAVPMITGEIKRFLRDDGMIKVSRSLKESGAKMKMAREKLQASLGREPNLQELSQETGLPREEIVMALEANGEVESIYKTYTPSDGKEACLADRLPQEKDSHEILLNHMLLEQLLAELGDTERRLIELRYFADRTQTQVAAELGISQVQVSRLEKKILLGMRNRV